MSLKTKKKSRLITSLILDLPIDQQNVLMKLCNYNSRQGFLKMIANPDNIKAKTLFLIKEELNKMYYAEFSAETLVKPLAEITNV